MVGLAIADGHPVVRSGLRLFFDEQPDVGVVAETSRPQALTELLVGSCADVLLLDLEMPGEDGLETLRRIRHGCPDVAVVVLTERVEPDAVQLALAAGAKGVVAKRAPTASLLQAVRAVSRGRNWLDPDLEQRLGGVGAGVGLASGGPAWELLTLRESQIAEMVTAGVRYRSIASRLGISEHTVRNHVRSVFEKLDVSNRVELAVLGEGRKGA